MEREIIVQGEAEVRVLPDLAELRAVADAEGDTREEAYNAAARLATRIDEVLGNEAAAITRATTAALVVQPRTRWRKGEQVRTGWRAQRTTVVEIRALERVGEIVSGLVNAGGAVVGPAWELDQSNEAHDLARRHAAEDARRRASSYAAGLGVELGQPSWISEPGLRLPGGGAGVLGRRVRAAPAAAAAFAAEGHEETIEVTLEEITIEAAVQVCFELIASR